MKMIWALALLAAATAQAQNTGDPVLAPTSTERFLSNVPDFAGGSTIPGRENEQPLSYRDGQGGKATSLPVPPSRSIQRQMTPGQMPASTWSSPSNSFGQAPAR
jgi:hypothetical protein